MFVWFVLSERKSVRIGLPTALSQLFLATFGNALCKDVAQIGVLAVYAFKLPQGTFNVHLSDWENA